MSSLKVDTATMNSSTKIRDSSRPSKQGSTGPSRIVFASCNSQHLEQTLWPAIHSRRAAAFLWTGDAVYADDFERKGLMLAHRDASPQEHKDLLQEQLMHPGYRKLVRDKSLTILGSLDDHDYGANNGDLSYSHRKQTGATFVEFLQAEKPKSNLTLMLQRAEAGAGVYGVKVFDFEKPQGEELLSDEEAGIDVPIGSTSKIVHLSEKSVAIFILDVRSNKDPWKTGFRKFFVDYQDDFLGEEQWRWFKQALSRSTATVNIIAQGLQVHTDRFMDGNLVEDWSRFPTSQHRFYNTILESNARAPIIVSGDVHMAELLRKDCWRQSDSNSRMLLEVTSSGLTHSWGTRICARPYSLACKIRYFDWSLAQGMNFAHHNGAWPELVETKDVEEGAKPGVQYTLELNFGEFEFDWDARQVIVRIHGKEENAAAPLLGTRWDFDMLSGIVSAPETGQVLNGHYDEIRRALIENSNASSHDYTCVAYRGPQTLLLKLYGFISSGLVASFFLLLPLILTTCIWMVSRRRKQKPRCKLH